MQGAVLSSASYRAYILFAKLSMHLFHCKYLIVFLNWFSFFVNIRTNMGWR